MDEDTVFKSVAIEPETVSKLPWTADAEAAAPAPYCWAEPLTPAGVAKLPLTDSAVANPVPDVIFIAPVTVKLLPFQTNLSPKLKFPELSI